MCVILSEFIAFSFKFNSKSKKSKDQRKLNNSSSSTNQSATPSRGTVINNSTDAINLKTPVPASANFPTASTPVVPLTKTDTHHMPLVPGFVSNSLTITPVDASDVTPKLPAKVQNKVTIINLDSQLRTSPNQSTSQAANNSQYDSPNKRATDHSITTIMASPSSDSSRPISVDSSPMTSPTHSSSSVAHVAKLERMAKPTVTLSKAATELQKLTAADSAKDPNSIRISSVKTMHATNNVSQSRTNAIELHDSDSEGIEFFDINLSNMLGSPSERFHDSEKNIHVNEPKYKMPGNSDSAVVRNKSYSDASKATPSKSLNQDSNGVDVNLIMQSLKELQVIIDCIYFA